jgi:hypothetical protein
MVDQGPTLELIQCPSYATGLGYLGVAAAVCFSNFGSAVSAQGCGSMWGAAADKAVRRTKAFRTAAQGHASALVPPSFVASCSMQLSLTVHVSRFFILVLNISFASLCVASSLCCFALFITSPRLLSALRSVPLQH